MTGIVGSSALVTGSRTDDISLMFDKWNESKRLVCLDNGQNLAYLDIGGEANPLLLLHGLTDSSLSFSGIAALLPGRRLIIPDLRGHGSSASPNVGYSLADFAVDARLLLLKLGIGFVAVAGHSLGGMVAQRLAGLFPEMIERLILIGTSASAGSTTEALIEELEALDSLDPNGEFMMRWYSNPGTVPKEFLAKLREDASAISLGTLKQILRELGSSQAETPLPITAPALLLWGDGDPFFDFSHQEKLLNLIPQAELIRLPGHGHNPFWESPGRVAQLISGYLDRRVSVPK
jgi:pimeloyl-ACP methyl ester carboxylesterase